MKADLYIKHFNFRERPFSLLPDPDFMYWSKSHVRAFSVLEYGLVTQAPITVLTGEVGTGKTTLVQALLRQVEKDVVVGLISNAQGSSGELLRWVLNAFEQPVDTATADYVSMFQQFEDFVLAQYAAGLTVVLIIDEAQNLSPITLEELRMLTNINSNKDELLQLILLGQPELREMISRTELRQFAQRVSVSYHLDPMTLGITMEYIASRLIHAGGTGQEFSTAAMSKIHELSGGIPRVINKLCDMALVYAASADLKTVGLETVDEVIADGVVLTTPVPALFLPRSNTVDSTKSNTADLTLPGKAAE